MTEINKWASVCTIALSSQFILLAQVWVKFSIPQRIYIANRCLFNKNTITIEICEMKIEGIVKVENKI